MFFSKIIITNKPEEGRFCTSSRVNIRLNGKGVKFELVTRFLLLDCCRVVERGKRGGEVPRSNNFKCLQKFRSPKGFNLEHNWQQAFKANKNAFYAFFLARKTGSKTSFFHFALHRAFLSILGSNLDESVLFI